MNEEKFVKNLIETTGKDQSSLGDDCALVENFNPPLLITTDQLVRDIHYNEHYTLENIASKIVGVNLSDMAAMGGKPGGALFYVASNREARELEKLSELVADKLNNHDLELLGGDLTGAPENCETTGLVLTGEKHPGGILRRNGGRAGDLIAVSGSLGAAGAIIEKELTGEDKYRDYLCKISDLTPLGSSLVEEGVECAIDISDGLLKDLRRVLTASGCGAVVNHTKIPVSTPAKNLAVGFPETIRWALTGGEDFELLVVFPENLRSQLSKYDLKVIGHLTDKKSTIEFKPDLPEKIKIDHQGYDHLAK